MKSAVVSNYTKQYSREKQLKPKELLFAVLCTSIEDFSLV